ncbi:hypothetical protein HmCmsJML116_03831 [Escherichia coli]|uniref:hypothetical protein n=1 Tax=Escherichia coli TaxID=562 RepID=UPI0010CBE5C6|nr:hypothetical protein [Escherichia coli]MCV5818777.1 hypothetical protein [Escherichia coli]GCW61575.1 hypothetical protein HmCmsJML116_03831 [Escherichia coli]
MLIEQQKKLIDEISVILPQDIIENFYNVIDYIDENRQISYYPIKRLRQASNCINDEQLLNIVKYFCGAHSRLFEITYCYYDEDSEEHPITAQGYFDALLNGIVPVSLKTGREIEDFDDKNISFYCKLNVER